MKEWTGYQPRRVRAPSRIPGPGSGCGLGVGERGRARVNATVGQHLGVLGLGGGRAVLSYCCLLGRAKMNRRVILFYYFSEADFDEFFLV